MGTLKMPDIRGTSDSGFQPGGPTSAAPICSSSGWRYKRLRRPSAAVQRSWEPRSPDCAALRTSASGTALWQTRQVAPRLLTVPSEGQPGPASIENATDREARSGMAFSQTSRPRFLETAKELRSGIVDLQAGLGQVMVRAHSQAITIARSPGLPPGTDTSG